MIEKPIPERLAVLEYRAAEMDNHLIALEVRLEKTFETFRRDIMSRFDMLDRKDGRTIDRLASVGTVLVALATLIVLVFHHY